MTHAHRICILLFIINGYEKNNKIIFTIFIPLIPLIQVVSKKRRKLSVFKTRETVSYAYEN